MALAETPAATTTHDPRDGYERIRLAPLTGTLGAEVEGVDLGDVDEDTFAELHRAFLDHKVLFFRDQHCSTADHVAFGRRWGDLEVHPFIAGHPDHSEVLILESTGDKPNAAESWHSDVTFRACPSLGSILRGRIIPPVGGDTVWADMERAYEGLSDRIKSQIEGRMAVHSMEKVFGRGMTPDERARALEEYPPQRHPVVRTHPETGRRCLFVNGPFTVRIEDMEPEESDQLLRRLITQPSVPQYQCRFRWQPDSVAMWDNRCTQHYAVPDFYPHHRRMERVTVVGDRPR
jgi:taurine dioxygenase